MSIELSSLRNLNKTLKNVAGTCPTTDFPANIFLFKEDKKRARKRCEICSKLTIKKQNDIHGGVKVSLLHGRRSGVFVVNF